jgi:hypothetical protein
VTDETMVNRGTHGVTPMATPDREPAAEAVTPDQRTSTTTVDQESMVPLFPSDQCQNLRSRWENLQVSFVDEPRRSVEQADRLVIEAIDRLSKGFTTQRERLEQQWHRDQNVSTEELRMAFQRYRSFFERLLSV